MKKLSKIIESIWSDIQDRNSGDITRREDSIDNLDDKGLYHYLLKHYEMVNSSWKIDYYPTANMIHVPIVNNPLTISFIDICVFDDQTVVYLSNFKRLKKIYQKIQEHYKIWERSSGFPYVTPLDGGKCTNSFAVEFLDFLLDACTTHCKVISKVNESIWSDIQDRNSGEVVRKEDIPEQDFDHWWRNIPLKDVPKYKKDELRLWDFLYDLVIWKVENTMNIQKPETIRIHFKYEDAWYISIYHNTAHGSDNYTMEANGTRGYSPEKYSNLNIEEKRSIRYRLEKKTFYIYPIKHGSWTEYILREEPEINGEKGVLMK